MSGEVLAHNYQFQELNADPATSLANGNYPASAAFIDVSGMECFDVVVRLITIADALVLTPQIADAIDGTPANIDATIIHTMATDDDGEFVTFHVETRKLGTSPAFFSLKVAGVSGTNTADMFLLGNVRPQKPVTQPTALLPAASQYVWAG